ncbi:MAG: hypothetical protein IPK04_14695 [Bdellovibrionales bacterium]|nr:hypothetical protein [Bdellovibrionales bacterium]
MYSNIGADEANFLRIFLVILFSCSGQASVFEFDFEELIPGSKVVHPELRVTRDEHTGAKFLRATYEPSSDGSKRLVFRKEFVAANEYTLNYRVYFENGFDFKKGGKLPGLGPLVHVTGCRPEAPEKWSVRLMWGPNGRLSLYTYEQNRTRTCGLGQSVDNFKFETGRWYNIGLYVKLNDAKKDDGIIHIYVDGNLVLTRDDVRLRGVSSEDTLIQRLLFDTFYGGNKDWAPPHTTYARFDDFEVSSGLSVRNSRIENIAYDRAVLETTQIMSEISGLVPNRKRPNGEKIGEFWDTARLSLDLSSQQVSNIRLASSNASFNEKLIREYARVLSRLSHRMVDSVGGRLPTIELMAHSHNNGEIGFKFPNLQERRFDFNTERIDIIKRFSEDLSYFLSLSANVEARNALLSVNWDNNLVFNYGRIAMRFFKHKGNAEINDFFHLKARLLKPSFVRPNGEMSGQWWDTAQITFDLTSGMN